MRKSVGNVNICEKEKKNYKKFCFKKRQLFGAKNHDVEKFKHNSGKNIQKKKQKNNEEKKIFLIPSLGY